MRKIHGNDYLKWKTMLENDEMNNTLKYILLTSFVFLVIAPSVARGGVSVLLSGNMLFPSDENYKLIYGDSKILPEAKLSVNLVKGMFMWAGFGYLSASGTTPVLMESAKSEQMLISSGIGYRVSLANRLGMSIRAGLLYALCKETAMGETVSTSAIGFVVSGGPYFNFSKTFGIEIEAGYAGASTTVEDVAVKIGGFKAGLGLSLSF